MKTWIYAKRNAKELLSDPLSLLFTLGLPIFLVVFMTMLNNRLGVNEAFAPENFVPATIIFSYAFLSMFSALLVAKDRSSSFLSRMYTSPLKSHHYIIGYMLPVLFIALMQAILLYLTGLFLGLTLTVYILISIPFLLLISILFISIGILLGSILKDSQVGPIASILIQIVAFLSGMWFSLDIIGGAFKTIGYLLPFAHSVDLIRDVLQGNLTNLFLPLVVNILYIALTTILAVIVFKRNMQS